MKHFIIWVMSICLAFIIGNNEAKAQSEIKREGKTFVQTSSRASASSNDVVTEYKWKDSKGNEYPIVLHQYSKGDKAGRWTCYINKISAKTGKEYKYYLKNGEEIAATIRKEMGLS